MANPGGAQARFDKLIAVSNVHIVAFDKYMSSGDLTHIEGMPEVVDTLVYSFIGEAVREADSTPYFDALGKVAMHRIAAYKGTGKDEFPLHFLQAFFGPDAIAAQRGQHFIDSCNEAGIDNYSLAVFWIKSRVFGNTDFRWIRDPHPDLDAYLSPETYFVMPEGFGAKNAMESLLLELTDDEIISLLQQFNEKKGSYSGSLGTFQAIMARDRPEVFTQYVEKTDLSSASIDWPYILGATTAFDDVFLQAYPLQKDYLPLIVLDRLRDGQYTAMAQAACLAEPSETHKQFEIPLAYLAETNTQLLVERLDQCIQTNTFRYFDEKTSIQYCKIAAEQWEEGGDAVFAQLEPLLSFDANERTPERSFKLLMGAAIAASSAKNKSIAQWITSVIHHYPDPDGAQPIQAWWEYVSKHAPLPVESKLWEFLEDRRKAKRKVAVIGLSQKIVKDAVLKATELLNSKKIDSRLGAVELLAGIGTEAAAKVLHTQMSAKHAAKVRKEIVKGLEVMGRTQTLDDAAEQKPLMATLDDIESNKSIKLPKSTSWVVVDALPVLVATDGTVLSEKAITFLIGMQAKHKTIKPAPDAMALLAHIDQQKSGDFAIALLKQWLASKQDVTDRWVLTLAGLLGDKRVLPALTDRINDWAEASRHKLAEYAAQAIALVSEDESLMILDSLANRYRSRYRNIGKACKAALEQAAETQGVTVDELADMIVPSLDFDAEYQRALPDTDIRAVLQSDFKLTFFSPTTESETKSPPSSLPDAAVEEIKAVRKLIRETVKGQTTRLEQSLVGQRTWSRQRWQELFEINPFLQSYASRLVWCSLNKAEIPQKYFRRYPNGLLANAEGEMIEFDNSDYSIVMAHPLNFEGKGLQDWIAHLARMNVKPPFAQLERPTVVLEANHGNRKVMGLTDKHQMLCGTFRARAERLGWVRGSVVDGGGITAYYKNFQGSPVSVFIGTEDLWVGQDPTDTITLGQALFVKSDSVQVGSYVYDEPKNTEDPRVLAFSEVPPIVYSETVADLQVIIG